MPRITPLRIKKALSHTNAKFEIYEEKINGTITGVVKGFIGFVGLNGRWVYINANAREGIHLWRSAESARDYRGGNNNFEADEEAFYAAIIKYLEA